MTILDQLVKELQAQQKHTYPAGVHSNPNVHGPGGLFGVSGLERDVISSRVSGQGLASVLPVRPSNTKYPLYPYITGKTPATGSQVTSSCEYAPTAGNLKSCLQTAQFGLYQFRTRELELDTVGALVDAGERTDLQFVNDPLAAQIGQLWFGIQDKRMALMAGHEQLMRFVELGMDFEELLSEQLYTGTGVDNEFWGLELLVTETHYDAQTGLSCDALASDVRDFGDVDISTSAGAAALVAQLVDMYRNRKYLADRMGFSPVQFAFVMRDQTFVEVSDIWPCAFMTSGCVPTNSNVSVNINTDEQIRMRVDMQTNKYLPIDGEMVKVITDSWMPETDLGGNVFSSDVYLLPISYRGNRPGIWIEYFDYNNGVNMAIREGRMANNFWIDGGKYLVAQLPPKAFCTQYQVKIEPRLRLELPQLSGRLMNVGYSLLEHWRDSSTSSLYYVNGGVSTARPHPSLYDNAGNIIS